VPIIVLDMDSTYEEHINDINDESYEVASKNILPLKNSIDIHEDFKNILLSFMEYFSAIETLNYKNFRFEFSSTFPENLRTSIEEILIYNKLDFEEEPFMINNEVNNIYDTAYMIPFIIDNVVNHKGDLSFIRAFDVLDKQVNITNELFFGYPGLINDKGIKKPAFYAYSLLNKLGNTLVAKGDGYVVTKTNN